MEMNEVKVFIDEMAKLDDQWTKEQVNDVYGKTSLQEALENRKKELEALQVILNKAMKLA